MKCARCWAWDHTTFANAIRAYLAWALHSSAPNGRHFETTEQSRLLALPYHVDEHERMFLHSSRVKIVQQDADSLYDR